MMLLFAKKCATESPEASTLESCKNLKTGLESVTCNGSDFIPQYLEEKIHR